MIDEHNLWPMSEGAFAHLGAENFAYIRPVEVENVRYFVLMSAQGQELVVAGSYEAALAAAYERDLTVVRLN
ncbi:MAG: DUF1150 family protein [Alphaproteobacteria bacterium]|nr:DUF1150 family protein [Alphaproteobacteria bacterium]